MRRSWIWLGIILLGVGLLGHLLAARAIGGYYIAYRDHIFGFFILTLASAVIIAGLGWRFWKGRHDITLGLPQTGWPR
jgi:NADH:ubiquinone oxidoreductase subunit K